MIKAEVLAHSINGFKDEIMTMKVTMPRIILAEFNTHRMLSRNSASSRAIPARKMIESIRNTPFIPIAFQKDHSGMQGTEYLIGNEERNAITQWLAGKDEALERAGKLLNAGVTKQLCNRLLEPFMYHTVIVTATEWENFFALRCPQYQMGENLPKFRSKKDAVKYLDDGLGDGIKKDSKPQDWDKLYWLQCNKGQAEIHMMALAEAIWDAYNESVPKLLEAGEWHIPYNKECVKLLEENTSLYPSDLNPGEIEETHDDIYTTCQKVKISTMMLARTSYTVIGEDGKEWKAEKYLEKHDELINANPKHMSPFEHCAKNPSNADELIGNEGNFRGFIQYRKLIPNENITRNKSF